MRRFAVLGLVLAAALGVHPVGTAGAADTVAAAGDVEMFVPGGKGSDPRNVLLLHLYPQRGVALVSVREGYDRAGKPVLVNSYAIAIPKEQFEGSIDVKFPRLGEVTGQITSSELSKPELPAKACDGRVPIASAAFEGRLRFRGFGDHRTWTAHKAEGTVEAECDAPALEAENETEVLFGALGQFRPLLLGPGYFRFLAGGRSPGRVVEFLALGSGYLGTFQAVDKEWLPGDVATERVVSMTTSSFGASIEVGAGEHPKRVTFTPPAPFFGHATYRRSTHKLRGSLGARFLGLNLRLARRPMRAVLEDEERQPSAKVDRAF